MLHDVAMQNESLRVFWDKMGLAGWIGSDRAAARARLIGWDCQLYTGWWFGTFFLFPCIGNVIYSQLTIFQRGRSTTSHYQPSLIIINHH